jgi:hypothetical protein
VRRITEVTPSRSSLRKSLDGRNSSRRIRGFKSLEGERLGYSRGENPK